MDFHSHVLISTDLDEKEMLFMELQGQRGGIVTLEHQDIENNEIEALKLGSIMKASTAGKGMVLPGLTDPNPPTPGQTYDGPDLAITPAKPPANPRANPSIPIAGPGLLKYLRQAQNKPIGSLNIGGAIGILPTVSNQGPRE